MKPDVSKKNEPTLRRGRQDLSNETYSPTYAELILGSIHSALQATASQPPARRAAADVIANYQK
jgi:hypothetical protein